MRLPVWVVLGTVLLAMGGMLLGSTLLTRHTLDTTGAVIDALYDRRVVPLQQLKIVSDDYAVFVADAAHKVRNGNFDWADGVASVEQAQKRIGEKWREYRRSELTGDELTIAQQAENLFGGADRAVSDLIRIMKAKEAAGLDTFVKFRLYQTIDPISEQIAALIELQVKESGVAALAARAQLADAVSISNWLLGMMGVVFMGGLAIVLLRVVRPLAQLTGATRRLAAGEMSTQVPAVRRRDEVGDLARAVQVFRDGLLAAEEAKRATQLATSAQMQALEREASSAIERVRGGGRSLSEQAKAMAGSATRVGEDAQAVALSAGQALSGVETVASVTEELGRAISEISTQMTHASTVTRRVISSGEGTRAAVDELSATVDRIRTVSGLIADIAEQTNLLALNATIEAARAGEAGRGFAVVAAEVKSLAGQTATATQEIAAQIESIRKVTEAARASAAATADELSEMGHVTSAIASAVEEQAAATQDITRSVQSAASAATAVSGRISNVAREAESTDGRARAIESVVGDLSEAIDVLREAMTKVTRSLAA